ncbi:L-threonylcarbamoyladenylate synthase [Candidatus Phytoplasma palmae]|uniref:L-threonylcarbamoyladenylate synthase n=1 Tax=Candidatus Phytoplasma palmae TaxID=85624 RepID=UPI0039908C0A
MSKKKIIIFPTDTVYGIGTKINDLESLKQIYKIKKRDYNKPIIILFYSLEQMKDIVLIDNNIIKISKFFWPGALTLIVNTCFSYYKKTNLKKIGIRIPNNKIALKLIQKEGPFFTTSVNQSGYPPLNDFEEIRLKYQNKVDFIYKNDQNLSLIPSTVIDITENNFRLIREGSISLKMIKKIIT